MRKSLFPSLLLTALTLALALAGSGCSPQAKAKKHLARGDKYLSTNELERAEIEYLNALKADPKNSESIAKLAIYYFNIGAVTRSIPYLRAAREMRPDDLAIRHIHGLFLAAVGQRQTAREEAIAILKMEPSHGEAPFLLVDACDSAQAVNEALQFLKSLPPAGKASASIKAALGILNLRLNRLKDGKALLDESIQLNPDLDLPYSVLASLAMASGRLDEAKSLLKSQFDRAPVFSGRNLLYPRFLLSRGETAEAVSLLKQIVEKNPTAIQPALLLAEVARSQKNLAEAETLTTRAIARDPNNPDALLLRSSVFQLKGALDKAQTDLDRLLSTFPSHPRALRQLASLHLMRNEPGKAMGSLNASLQAEPNNPDALLMLAELHLRQSDVTSCLQLLNDVIKQYPKNVRARVMMADAYRTQNRYSEALEVLGELEQEYPKDPQYPFMRGMLYLQSGHSKEGRQLLEKSYALSGEGLTALGQLMEVDLNERQYDSSISRLQGLLDKGRKEIEILVMLGRAFAAKGDIAAAEEAYRKAIAAQPDNRLPYFHLANLYIKTFKTTEAITNLAKVIEKNPRDTGAIMMIAMLHEEKKDFEAAKAAYEKILVADPKFGPALNNLAYLYAERFNRVTDANELASRARELAPNDPYAADTLGWILYRQGKYSWALSLIKEAAEKLPGSGEIQYHLGMTHYRLGDEAAARLAFESALRLEPAFNGRDDAAARLALLTSENSSTADLKHLLEQTPDDPIALNRLAAAHIREGRPKDAIELFQKLLKASPDSLVAKRGLARAQLAAKDYAAAIETARDVRKTVKEDGEMAAVLGRAAWATGDRRYAYSMLQEAVRRLPDDAGLRTDFAHAAYSQGRLQEALTAAPKLLQATGDAPTARVAALLDQGRKAADLATARKALEDALALYPEFTPAMRELAVRLAAAGGDDAKAYEYASKAREVDPTDKDLARALGTLSFRRGDFPRASTLLAEAAAGSTDAKLHLLLAKAQAQTKGANPKPAAQRALDLGLTGPEKAEAEAIVKK
ncbi:tetratricopeptide repeat protein [Nibricoccus sp. IMCC34717]|uniref:tetratricopeptide repeat protein n=1 Tax=Nibricoccus sp. IMCC34717 TaxID=3034021 RepID=UPI00384D8D8B